jgi:hypothetical protein
MLHNVHKTFSFIGSPLSTEIKLYPSKMAATDWKKKKAMDFGKKSHSRLWNSTQASVFSAIPTFTPYEL